MSEIRLMPTGVPNLDAVLGGGLPIHSLNVVAGAPGSGKTILAQQILFSHIQRNSKAKALYLSTLSEPSMKVVRYMQHFSFFDADAFGQRVLFRDLGDLLIEKTLKEVSEHIVEWVKQYDITLLVIDSFKAIHDLTPQVGEFRRFCYELSIQLACLRCTTFLVTESNRDELVSSAECAIADGIFYQSISEQSGLPSRFFQVYKLRGRNAYMEQFPFVISNAGIKVLSPSLTLKRRETSLEQENHFLKVGIPGFDELLPGGVPLGRSIILSGVSGTGKTTFALQFLVAGAAQGERGLIISFEETTDRLQHSAEGFGWDLAALEAEGLLQIIFVSQSDIRVEEQLEQLIQAVEQFQPKRLVVDSLSVFLFRVDDPALQREKTFQLVTLMQRIGGVGLLLSDIPANDTGRLSRFGVEETIADGTIVLSTTVTEQRRERYLEVFKMRASDYVAGRHRMKITPQGIQVLYVGHPLSADYGDGSPAQDNEEWGREKLTFSPLNPVLHDELSFESTWLIQGEPGLGKSTLAYQFAMEGLRQKESVLYVGTDIPAQQSRQALEHFGFLPGPYEAAGKLVMLDAFSRGNKAFLDVNDPEAMLFYLSKQLQALPKPCRLVIDSIMSLAIAHSQADFVKLIYRKNQLLRQPGVVQFDVFLKDILLPGQQSSLLNAYDNVIDLYRPNWGDMNPQGNLGYPSLRVIKTRGIRSDTRPYPYSLAPTEGVVIQANYHQSSR